MSSSRVHILYIAEFSVGGSVESLFCLAGGLDKDRYKATVLFYEMPQEAALARFEAAGVTVCALSPRGSGRGGPKQLKRLSFQAKVRKALGGVGERWYVSLKDGVRFVRFRLPLIHKIRREVRRIRPDLVHVNNGVNSDTPGILAARACGVPVVCHARSFSKVTRLDVASSRRVRAFLCISHAVREHLVTAGVRADRCTVVPNAVDPPQFDGTEPSGDQIRSDFGWGGARKLFILVGRVVPWKGQEVFIRAIAEARQTNPAIVGLVVGDGEETAANEAYRADLATLVNSLLLKDSLKFTGHRTDVPVLMQAADGVVCASSSPEPFGRVIIESMAVNTPVIATNAGGAPDIVTDGVNGLLVPMRDSVSMAEAMVRLSHDVSFAEEMRAAGIATVATRFGVERHVEAVCETYRSVLGL